MGAVAAPPRATGRGRQSAAVEAERDLVLELRAAGQEMRSAGFAIQYADRAGRRDLILHAAASLISRGERYARS